MARGSASIWIRSILGVALIIGLPALLVYALRSAYQSSPEPGKIATSALEFVEAGKEPPAPPPPPPAPPTPPVVAPAPEVPGPPPSPAIDTTLSLKVSGECAKVQEEVDEIKARMAQTYTSAEGEFYRERLIKLGNQLHELKCGR
ncbi:MAG TPA: hypothetical protein VE046_10760 [Steroidobacteraceae bacterium]|nr:hypothetical protein [Steroidobacteraceae bacterium]